MKYEEEIESKLRELPEDLRREAIDYLESLINRRKIKKSKTEGFKFDWEGGLEELKDKFTSVELQHRAAELR